MSTTLNQIYYATYTIMLLKTAQWVSGTASGFSAEGHRFNTQLCQTSGIQRVSVNIHVWCSAITGHYWLLLLYHHGDKPRQE